MLTLPQEDSEAEGIRKYFNLPPLQLSGLCLIAWGHPWESALAPVNVSAIGKPCSDSCSFITFILDKELLLCSLGTTGKQEVTAQQNDLLLLSVLLSMSHHSLRAMQQVQELVLTSAKKAGPL